MDLSVLWALIVSFAITAVSGPFVIPYLRKLKYFKITLTISLTLFSFCKIVVNSSVNKELNS